MPGTELRMLFKKTDIPLFCYAERSQTFQASLFCNAERSEASYDYAFRMTII